MFDFIGGWFAKFFGSTYIKKAIRNGLMGAAVWLHASEFSVCSGTAICKDIALLLGQNTDLLVDRLAEVVLFVIGAALSVKAAKAETVGNKVLKG